MRKLLYGMATIAAAGMLAGCGKGIPSCGDPQVTGLVAQTLANAIEKVVPDMDANLKSAVHLSVDQPVVVDHDEKLDNYSCKAVVTYQVPDAVVQMQARGQSDEKYKKYVQFHWRRLMGLYSQQDVQQLVQGYAFSQSNAQAQLISNALRTEVHASADESNEDVLTKALIQAKENTEALNNNAVVLVTELDQAAKNAQKLTFAAEYTIAKVDGQQQFRVEAKSDDSDAATGIRDIQVLQAATVYVNQALAADQSAAQAAASAEAASASAAKPTPLASSETVTTPTAQAAAPTAPPAAPPAAAASGPLQASASSSEQSPPQVSASEPEVVKVAPAQNPSVATKDASPAVIQASFDCAKAASSIEHLICSTPETADADKRLAIAYSAAREKASDQAGLKSGQREWLTKERNVCADTACLLRVTESRIQKLSPM